MSLLWFEFYADEADIDGGGDAYSFVAVDGLEGAKALARKDGKTWGLLTLEERTEYEDMICEALVSMGGERA